jgi:peptidoglycan/xylan/chitin deacetylase (PgdA/CDA1 family)
LLDRTCIAGKNNWQDMWWEAASRTGVLAIGNHSWDHVHPGLPTVAQREQRKGSFYGIDTLSDADRQIRDAEHYIRNRLAGRSTGLFAYPYGQAPDYIVHEYLPRFAEELGISAAFTTAGDFATTDNVRWKIPRFVHGDDWKSPNDLVQILRAANRPSQIACSASFDEHAAGIADHQHTSESDPTFESAFPPAPVVVHERLSARDTVERQEPATATGSSQGLSSDDVICAQEVTNPKFFVGGLFHRHFRSEVPSYGAHRVVFCRGPNRDMSVIGYMHILTRNDMVFCGGMVVDEEQRRSLPVEYRRLTRGPQGVMDLMLRATIRRSSNAAAIWSYVGDPVIEASMLQAGFVRTSYVHLMVIWKTGLPESERTTRLATVVAMGPF